MKWYSACCHTVTKTYRVCPLKCYCYSDFFLPSHSSVLCSPLFILKKKKKGRWLCRCPHTSVVQLNLSLSGKPGHSPLSSQNWKPTSSLLPTDLSLYFFCFHQTHDYCACVFAGCVCGCVWVCGVFVWVCGVFVCVACAF